MTHGDEMAEEGGGGLLLFCPYPWYLACNKMPDLITSGVAVQIYGTDSSFETMHHLQVSVLRQIFENLITSNEFFVVGFPGLN